MAKNCKYCGELVATGKMPTHVMNLCQAYRDIRGCPAVKPKAAIASMSFDPVAIIAWLDASVILEEISATEKKLDALHALLIVANAKHTPKPMPERNSFLPPPLEAVG